MRFYKKKWWQIGIAIIFSLSFVTSALASNTSELNRLKTLISKLKSNINAAHKQQSNLQQKLKETEINAGNTANQITTTQNKLATQKTLLVGLQNQQINYEAQLKNQQAALTTQIQAAYMLSRQPTLKMLLNNQDPNKVSRLLTYYKYVHNARLDLIDQYSQVLMKLNNTQHRVKVATVQLSSLESQQQEQYKKLLTIKQQRQELLKNVQQNIKSQQQKLDKYIADEKALAAIIRKLNTKTSTVTFTQSLSKSPKKFRWPASGNLENLYGKSIANSQLTWDGVLIDASEGTKVQAIAPGKVVFSQWLQGYGLLLIVDHGHGYMSLYGRNNILYKRVGDIVKTGDLIATVGNSGGFENPSLYFAIRYNGKPVNPNFFCS